MNKTAVVTLTTAAAIVGGVLLSNRDASIVAPPPRSVTLTWDYSSNAPAGIVFNVYARENLNLGRWQLLTTVTGKSLTLPAELPAQFFTVTASNVVTHQESDLP